MSSASKSPVIMRPGIALTHRTENVPDHRYPSARTKAGYGPGVQIQELTAHINRKLHQVSQLVRAGRMDQAGKVCDIISTDRARLVLLVTQLDQMTPDQAPAPVLAKPKNKVVRKPKTYGRWSEK